MTPPRATSSVLAVFNLVFPVGTPVVVSDGKRRFVGIIEQPAADYRESQTHSGLSLAVFVKRGSRPSWLVDVRHVSKLTVDNSDLNQLIDDVHDDLASKPHRRMPDHFHFHKMAMRAFEQERRKRLAMAAVCFVVGVAMIIYSIITW